LREKRKNDIARPGPIRPLSELMQQITPL